jgi:hypothetical protein
VATNRPIFACKKLRLREYGTSKGAILDIPSQVCFIFSSFYTALSRQILHKNYIFQVVIGVPDAGMIPAIKYGRPFSVPAVKDHHLYCD